MKGLIQMKNLYTMSFLCLLAATVSVNAMEKGSDQIEVAAKVKTPNTLICDLGGIFFNLSNWSFGYNVAATIGVRAFLSYMAFDWKSPNVKQKLFATMERFPLVPKEGFARTRDRHGTELPYLLCAYQAGLITSTDIFAMSGKVFDQLRSQNFFASSREEAIIRQSLEGTFNSDFHATCTYVIPESIALLKQLAGQKNADGSTKYRIIALSNWDAESFAKVRKLFPEEFSYFNDIVISSAIKTIKPNRAAFEHVMQKHRLAKEDCVFIDDQLENVQAAIDYGIKNSILFTDCKKLKTDLVKLGIK